MNRAFAARAALLVALLLAAALVWIPFGIVSMFPASKLAFATWARWPL